MKWYWYCRVTVVSCRAAILATNSGSSSPSFRNPTPRSFLPGAELWSCQVMKRHQALSLDVWHDIESLRSFLLQSYSQRKRDWLIAPQWRTPAVPWLMELGKNVGYWSLEMCVPCHHLCKESARHCWVSDPVLHKFSSADTYSVSPPCRAHTHKADVTGRCFRLRLKIIVCQKLRGVGGHKCDGPSM